MKNKNIISNETLKECFKNIENYEQGKNKNDELYNLSVRIFREVGSNEIKQE